MSTSGADERAPGQYKAQEGTWELRAPDGTSWHESSPMACLRAEMRDRIPAKVALARIFDPAHDEPALASTDSKPPASGADEVVGWLESPHGHFRPSPLWRLDPPPQTLAWQIPLTLASTDSPEELLPGPVSGPDDQFLVGWNSAIRACRASTDSKPQGALCGFDLLSWQKGFQDGIYSATPDGERPAVEALRWILPMAKGYAHEHPVGRNAELVAHAEQVASTDSKPDGSRKLTDEEVAEIVGRMNDAEPAGGTGDAAREALTEARHYVLDATNALTTAQRYEANQVLSKIDSVLSAAPTPEPRRFCDDECVTHCPDKCALAAMAPKEQK